MLRTFFRVPITLIRTTHEPPSRAVEVPACSRTCRASVHQQRLGFKSARVPVDSHPGSLPCRTQQVSRYHRGTEQLGQAPPHFVTATNVQETLGIPRLPDWQPNGGSHGLALTLTA